MAEHTVGESGMRFVVGLGNPGRRYERTRHNVGFWVLESLVRRWSAEAPRRAFDGLLWETRRPSGRVLLLAPQTFMNCSGQAAAAVAGFYKAAPEQMMLVLDDLALPTGKIRIRSGGSAGGHNGLADVLTRMGTTDVPRLRIGIGEPPGNWSGIDYVLSEMNEDERADANAAVEQACKAVEDWLSDGIVEAMNRNN